jgi:Family of unknown function (DUF5989)
MAFLLEFWWFLRVRKKYWLLPVLLMMVVFGGLIVLTQGSAVAPFICSYIALGKAADLFSPALDLTLPPTFIQRRLESGGPIC